MAGETTRTRRRWTTLLARLALGLLLLSQLAVLWVIAHPSPTRLPAGVLSAIAELVSGPIDVECREATVDRRGRLRLGGVRISDPRHPGDEFTGDIDVLPDWRGLLTGSPAILGLQVRGHGSLGESGAAIDDFVSRLTPAGDEVRLEAAARAGSMVLHATAAIPSRSQAEANPAPTAPGWDRTVAIDCLRALRAMNGAIGLTIGPGGASARGAFIENTAAVSSLPIQAAAGELRARWDGHLRAELRLRGLRGWGATVERAWVGIGDQLRFRALLEAGRLDGLSVTSATARGKWTPGQAGNLELFAETTESRVAARLEFDKASLRVRDAGAVLAAADLTRLSPVAQGAREAGIDLCGRVEILGGEVDWDDAKLASARGSFALSQMGWRDLRPALVRPEQSRACFRGDLSVDLARNHLALTRLDLAGIRGEIEGGLRTGDNYVIRLSSSEGQPVNPSCLNALLGKWWVDLWARFDLSTRPTRPHADVRVEGRWGDIASTHTRVRARLEHFGFMETRFRSVDLRVLATDAETLLHIDSLEGELAGRPAGTAHGIVRWDWRHPEWEGQPQIEAQGDMAPACAIRLYDPSLAARLDGVTFGQGELRVSTGPARPTRATLKVTGTSTLGGVKVDQLSLNVSKAPGASGDLALEASGLLGSGKASLSLTGDLAHRNQVELSVREWNRSGVESLIGQLNGAPAADRKKDPSQLTVLYKGSLDFEAPWATQGEGQFSLSDPSLKTIHLLGALSEGLDLLGIGFSNYPLNRAEAIFRCAEGKALLKPLKIEGEDALLNLKGSIHLRNGALDLSGRVYLKDSPWGMLKYINPNRLIAKMIEVNIGGTVNKPEVGAKPSAVNINK